MKKSPRLSAVALAAAALMTITGCAISKTPETSESPGTVTLRFWEYYSAGGQADWLKAQTAKFEAANPGVKVQLVETVGSQQDQKLLAAVATGNGPDILINNIVVDFPTLVAGGVMKDMTAEWNAYADKSQYPEAAAWKNDGKVYNLLSYTNLLGMYYNTDALASVGITTPPTTLEELEADMAKVEAGGKYKALAQSGAPTVEGAWLFAPQLLGQGMNYCNFGGQPVTDAFNRLGGWAQKGYLPKATATWDQNAAWQQFATGKYAFGFNGNWQLGNAKKLKFGYGTTQFPAPAGGNSVVYPGGEGVAIGAQSKHPDLAWKYIQEVFLSKDGGEALFKAAGSIPVRADVASVPAIKNDTLVQPFVKAAQTSGQWPNNPKTADMQTALGKAVSGVISGQLTAQEGADQAVKNVAAAQKAGGGDLRVTVVEQRGAAVRAAPPRRRGPGRSLTRAPAGYLLPAVALLAAFAAYPLVVLVRMAFSDVGPTNIVGVWNWVGGANFRAVLALPELWQALLRTAELCLVLLVSNLVLGFLVASVLSTSGRLTSIVLSIMVFVWALPPIVSGSVWKFLLDDSGGVNSLLGLVGVAPVNWLSSPTLALWTVGGVVAWAALPFSALILRGGLLAVPPDVVEAAAIDGAGYWKTQFLIVLPLLRPTMWILGIITVLYAFKSFDFFYVLTQGGPGTATNTMPVLSYYTAFSNYDMSIGATIAVISMLLVALLAIPYVRSIRSEVTE